MVSSEQEALHEIEDAIKRIQKGTYGICEITGKPIKKARLAAVPFTRYSLEGQRQLEASKSRKKDRNESLADLGADETYTFTDEDA